METRYNFDFFNLNTFSDSLWKHKHHQFIQGYSNNADSTISTTWSQIIITQQNPVSQIVESLAIDWKDVTIAMDEFNYKQFADLIIIIPRQDKTIKIRNMCYGTRRLMVLLCKFCKLTI